MSRYATVRGKIVALGQIHLDVEDEGALHIHVGSQCMLITEDEASKLYNLMSDVVEWKDGNHTTEGKLDKLAEQDDHDLEAGRLS